LTLVLVLLASALAPVAAVGQVGDVAATVSRYGLRPIEPPVAASDFSLPELGGGQRSLSDFAGRWVILTFWATWCGPCRAEMPSLERLHLSRKAAGVTVLGVSVDRRATEAERFMDQYSLTFPNLWDNRGEVGSVYRAQSIPLSYLVDPAGRLVAVSVGARDWTALQPMMDALLELAPAGQSEPEVYETTSTPIELPRTFEPPTGEVALLEPAPEVGQPFALEVRVRWAGNFDDYLLHPPRLELPEGVELEGQTASTSSAEGRNLVTYRLDLRAGEEGAFALSPLELVYTPRAEAHPVSSRLEGPTVTVGPATLLGVRPGTLAVAGVAVALVMAAAVVVARRSSARAVSEADEGDSLHLQLKERLDRARSRRLEGDLAGAALILAETELELGVESDSERNALEEAIEGARYGGCAPSREELDQVERRVERRIGELEADPRSAERLALRLRNQES
jgi:peroxiredoxin